MGLSTRTQAHAHAEKSRSPCTHTRREGREIELGRGRGRRRRGGGDDGEGELRRRGLSGPAFLGGRTHENPDFLCGFFILRVMRNGGKRPGFKVLWKVEEVRNWSCSLKDTELEIDS